MTINQFNQFNQYYCSFLPAVADEKEQTLSLTPRSRGRKKTLVMLVLIVLFAAFLRFYRLGSVPPSLDWDEVSLGYNAWSLLQTGHDEFGNSWPLTIRSFGDYKPPLYTYLLVPTLKLFGQTEFAIRFPSALAGTLTVLVTYLLTLELFIGRQQKNFSEHSENSESRNVRLSDSQKVRFSGSQSFPNNIAIITALLLAISPWHLQFSRIAFEANLGLFFFVAGMWLLLRALNKYAPWSLFLSVASFSAALMSYHSLRLIIPVIVISVLLIYRRDLWNKIKNQKAIVGISAILAILTIVTISYTIFIQKVGQARFAETSIFTITKLLDIPKSRIERFDANPIDRIVNHRAAIYVKQYIAGYVDHFNLRFWLIDGDRIDRHRAPDVGLIYFWEFPFLLLGLMSLMRSIGHKPIKVLIFWFFLAPTASAMTGGTPSAVRSLVFLPTFQIFTAIGMMWLICQMRHMSRIGKVLLLTSYSLLVIFEVSHYFHQYYVHAPIEYAKAWQYGYKQVVERAMADKGKYDQIIVTTSYDQPYVYVLWYGNYDPFLWVNSGEFNKNFDKFRFLKIEWQEMKTLPHALIIGDAREMGAAPVSWTIAYPDGTPAFIAAQTP